MQKLFEIFIEIAATIIAFVAVVIFHLGVEMIRIVKTAFFVYSVFLVVMFLLSLNFGRLLEWFTKF